MWCHAMSFLLLALIATFARSDESHVHECDEAGCGIYMVQMKVSGLPRLEGMQSEAQRAAQSDRSAGCLFVDSEIHQAVSHWLHVSAQDVEEAWHQLAQDQGCHARARQSLMSTTNFLKQKASLVRLLGSLSQLNLKPLRRPEIFENGTTVFTFDSVDDATNTIGTGKLGQFSATESVSEVVVQANQPGPFLWDLSASEMKFAIGPPIRGTFLISGTLWPLEATPSGIHGQMKAGFVNLRTTATGTWSTGSEGLAGNVSLSFGGFLQKSWTWMPS